jgi:hypothetical protein
MEVQNDVIKINDKLLENLNNILKMVLLIPQKQSVRRDVVVSKTF